MKKILLSILMLCALTACQQQQLGERAKYKTIMIKAQGEVETLPDVASFSIDLNCLMGNVKTAKTCLVDKSNELQQQLLAFGIKKEDLLTTSVRLEKEYDWTNKGRIFKGYNSSTSIYVTVKDLDKLDEIYTELLENRNLDINGLSYDHSQMEDLKNQAYVNALRNAKVLAETLLAVIPEDDLEVLKIGNVQITASVPPTEPHEERDYKMLEVQSDAAPQSIALNTGMVKVFAELYVEYQIK